MPQSRAQDSQPQRETLHPSALTERERQVWLDHEWVFQNSDIQQTYAGSVVAVAHQTVLGTGKTHLAALQAALARPDCPPREEIVTVAVEGCPLASRPTQDVKERP
jgi:hypothetical protein